MTAKILVVDDAADLGENGWFCALAQPDPQRPLSRAYRPFITPILKARSGSRAVGRGSAVVSPGAKPPQARRRELRTLEPQLRPRSTIGRTGQAHSAL
jgi:hypothetical protein